MRTTMLFFVLLAGCAAPGGQVGSNAAYEYRRTSDGGCEVTVYSGREQIEAVAVTITPDCELDARAQALTAGQTNETLLRILDRVISRPFDLGPSE